MLQVYPAINNAPVLFKVVHVRASMRCCQHTCFRIFFNNFLSTNVLVNHPVYCGISRESAVPSCQNFYLLLFMEIALSSDNVGWANTSNHCDATL
jgi:hypothetical protein